MTTAMTTPGDELVSMLRRIRVPERHIDRWIGAALVVLVALALGTLWVLDQRTRSTDFKLDGALTELHATDPASTTGPPS